MEIGVDFAVLVVKARIVEESEEEKTPQAGLEFAFPSRQKIWAPEATPAAALGAEAWSQLSQGWTELWHPDHCGAYQGAGPGLKVFGPVGRAILSSYHFPVQRSTQYIFICLYNSLITRRAL